MQFFQAEAKQKLDNLAVALPSKLYIPLNAGRKTGVSNTSRTAGSYNPIPPSKKVELTEWINEQINRGNISFGTSDTVATTDTTQTISGAKTFSNASFTLSAVPEYANDAAAGVGGLTAGEVYHTATGELRIKL